jgi:hypothetical protein
MRAVALKLPEYLRLCAHALSERRAAAAAEQADGPIAATMARRLSTTGTLHLYSLDVPADATLTEDCPVSLLLPDEAEPTEGWVVERRGATAVVQTTDSLGDHLPAVTLVPDSAGLLDTAAARLTDMADRPDAYALGPAERLLPWLTADYQQSGQGRGDAASTSVLTTIWSDDPAGRRAKLPPLVTELIRNNKRVLLISKDQRSVDDVLGLLARSLRAAGLAFRSLLSRYELPVQPNAAGLSLAELGFEAQMHQFYAQSRADKAALRRKYERFRELTPLLAYKAHKQQDLTEVKHLEWRLLSQISDLQRKDKEAEATVAEYESLPIWKRLGMQTVGKNVETLQEYRTIYQRQVRDLMREMEVAQRRIEELTPEAAIPKELRPEYAELKDEIKRLGGTQKIRELLAAEEGTNRQAFIQVKRVIATTAVRVLTDPLFAKVRFDALVADEAPFIPAPYLIGAAGLVRERIVLSGDTRDLAAAGAWSIGAAAHRLP